MYPPIYYIPYLWIYPPRLINKFCQFAGLIEIIGAPCATVTYRVKNIPTSL